MTSRSPKFWMGNKALLSAAAAIPVGHIHDPIGIINTVVTKQKKLQFID